jgi:hypothetical protein
MSFSEKRSIQPKGCNHYWLKTATWYDNYQDARTFGGNNLMSNETIRDARGNIRGIVITLPDGMRRITTPAGSPLGYYDPRQNRTYTATGGIVGSGDLLMSLLPT